MYSAYATNIYFGILPISLLTHIAKNSFKKFGLLHSVTNDGCVPYVTIVLNHSIDLFV